MSASDLATPLRGPGRGKARVPRGAPAGIVCADQGGPTSRTCRYVAVTRIAAVVAALLILSSAVAAAATPVRATSSVERNSITIGDPLLFTLVVDTDSGYRVVDPGVVGGTGGFELRETLRPELQELGAGGTRHIFRYRITAFSLGDHTIPPIDVTYQDPAGGRGVARTEGLTVQVRSVVRDGEDTRDIKPLKPQLELADPLSSIGTALRALSYLLVVLTAVVVVLDRGRASAAATTPLTPAERALGELGRIASLRLPEQGRFGDHYELVSRCLRRYAREQFGITAAARTPRELRIEMARAGVPADESSTLDAALVESERVRFGRAAIRSADAQRTVRRAAVAIAAAHDRTAQLRDGQAQPAAAADRK